MSRVPRASDAARRARVEIVRARHERALYIKMYLYKYERVLSIVVASI